MIRPMRLLALACLVACSSGGNRPPTSQADATAPRASTAPTPDGGAATAPTPDSPPSCEPYAVCGCEVGCVTVQRLAEGRYRVAQGPQAGQVLVRESPEMPLHPDGAETCDESCRPAAATRTCRMTGETCAEVAATD